ncbi:ROK family transcriptional regulator [Anaerocolumna sp. AGMB13025]|uniref:ROK family transcriptional regulator n=1 Tax=Anaerocolumna sp. AGMB13025 TaxID=3039116 RepID=UPI00241E2E90|nr:ROK family transcriptional regulator [Anaerocolumna sp. AGMB13025]WFR55459.1 ROK family transcriptional regulator [Anaerocolumna sp. AGMB13025]
MTGKKITSIEVKKMNKNRIFKLIYNSREIARQEIAAQLSLSLPTVNQNLKELTEEGLIEYGGNFQSTGGRKAQAITPVGEAVITIGLEIRRHHVSILAIDLYGTVLDYEKYLKTFSEEEEYSRYLGYLVHNIVEHNHFDKDKILGVGIAVPGVFDQNKEYIIKAPSLGISCYPLSKLTQAIEYPCIVDNDANAGAFTELWSNPMGEDKAYLSVGKGVGGCIIKKDELYKGHHHRAGEFGHMTVSPGGKLCNCGQRGCLEAYISTARISDDLGCQIEDFFSELDAGNIEYLKIWDEYLKYLCIGINNIYMVYDSDVVLGGVLAQYLDPYLEEIQKRLAERNFFEKSGEYFKLTQYQSRATAIGAALQLVSKFIEGI